MSIRVLHLSCDDKFTDIALRGFEKVLPNSNSLLVYSKRDLTFIKSQCEHIKNEDLILKNVLMYTFDLIVIHCLNECWVNLILQLPKDIKIIWLGWGYDYYDLIDIDLYLPLTKNIVNKKSFLNLIKSKFKKNKKIERKKKAVGRINYFSPVLELEYYQVKKKFSGMEFPEYIDFNYGSLDVDFIKGFEGRRVNGHGILIGNSATYENNHLDIFDLLNRVCVKKYKFIVPLSYGVDKYGEILKNRVTDKENVIFLDNYMPLDDYINVIIECDNVIMGHIRQQALGNILSMLYLGAKVFLLERNPIYTYLKENGLYVYSIEELLEDPTLIDIKIDITHIIENRKILAILWSESIFVEKINKITQLVII